MLTIFLSILRHFLFPKTPKIGQRWPTMSKSNGAIADSDLIVSQQQKLHCQLRTVRESNCVLIDHSEMGLKSEEIGIVFFIMLQFLTKSSTENAASVPVSWDSILVECIWVRIKL